MAGNEDALSKAKDLLMNYGMVKSGEAQTLVHQALAECKQQGDAEGQVSGLKVLIDMHLTRKEFDDALQMADQAVGVASGGAKKAKAMMLIAEIHLAKMEGISEAMAVYNKAIGLYREAGDKAGEAEVLGVMSQIHLEHGDTEQAFKVANDAVAIANDAATAKHTIAQVQLARGNAAAAIESAAEMLAICRDKGNKAGQANASLVLANAILSQDESSLEGLQCGREALALSTDINDVYCMQSTLHTLANGYFVRGDLEEGLRCAREALACFHKTGDTANEEVLKITIEEARYMTQEYRKQVAPKPFVLPASGTAPPPLSGPLVSPDVQQVPQDLLDDATAGRKYWGAPPMVAADSSVDALDRPPSSSIVWAVAVSDNSPTQACVEFGDLVGVMAKNEVAKIPIVVMTCGVYGRSCGEMVPTSITNVSAATIWGMVRVIRQEVPQVTVQLLDFSDAMTSAEVPRCIRPMLPECAFYNKARWEPQISAVPSLFRRDLKRDSLTGSGGGGTASDLKKTAKFSRKAFSWMGPNSKLDFMWYRQEWKATGPAYVELGPMPQAPPCRVVRTN